MPHARASADAAGTAKLLVVLLAFAWGFNWIAAPIAMRDISPWSLRFAGSGIGAVILLTSAFLTGHSLRVPRNDRIPIMIAGFLNVAGFQLLSAFAQMYGATERVVIITYSMPIWATALSCIVLRERLTTIRIIALILCVAGLTVLISPLVAGGVPNSVVYSLGAAFCWAAATVYIKWAKVKTEPLINAAWQLAFGFLFITAGTFIFDGYPRLWPIHVESALAVLFAGIIGVGLAHFLWWSIVDKVSPITASIGSLLVPVVAVVASAIVLGERPTVHDMFGFALIFAAAACVLLQPNVKHTEMPE